MKKCVIIILTFLYIIQGTAKDTREIIIRGDSAFPPYEFYKRQRRTGWF